MRVWTLLGLGATLVACSGDDHPPPIGDHGRALPECPELNVATCDTRVAACQQQLLALAGCVYGVANTPNVPVRVVSEAQLIEELNAENDDADETAADLPHIERALVDLKLLQAGDLTEGGGSTAQIVDDIDGVYQDAERGIALVDRGEAQNDAESNALLLHEFVHAIQDAEFNLAAWREAYPRSIDASLALRSVTEGQATYAQFRVLLAMTGRDLDRIDWERTLSGFRDQIIPTAFDDPSPYLASVTTFPYAYGAASAFHAWSDHPAQFDAPPLTTLEVLRHDIDLDFPVPAGLSVESPTPDADHRLVDSDTLGAFQLALSAHALGADMVEAMDFALAWRGDQLAIYAGLDETTAWLWVLELADDYQASALVELLQDHPHLEAAASGKRVTLIGGDARPQFVTDAGAAFLLPAP